MAQLKIRLLSDLCAGSGEATGMTVDSDLCMDEMGFPYVPARRVKGVLREAADLLCDCGATARPEVDKLFGTAEQAGQIFIGDAFLPHIGEMHTYLTGGIPSELNRSAAPLNIARLFTSVRGQTRLENGVAADSTLRFTRVLDRHNALHPEQETELIAEVTLKPDANVELFKRCCAAVRHIGLDRTRGLGNVHLSYSPEGARSSFAAPDIPEGETLRIEYTLALDAPVTLPGCAEQLDEIPGRSVIGCLAAQCEPTLEDFSDLFLNGTVRWSALTPRICGVRSLPAPLSLVRLKDEGVYVNRVTASPEDLMGKKLKAVDGRYLAVTDKGGRLAGSRSHTLYHHSHKNETLYMQDSLDAGMLYSGYADVPRCLAGRVLKLLCEARFSFGRSKSAQYGSCSLAEPPKVTAIEEEKRRLPEGTPVWVLLESDMVLCEEGLYTANPQSVRAALAEQLHLRNARPDGKQDYCQSHVLSGYQAQWGMPKPQLPAMRGGSLFVFLASGESIPAQRQLGEFAQEGLGVFRILTEQELALSRIEKAQADLRTPEEGSEGTVLEKAMAAAELERVFREEVSRLHREMLSAKRAGGRKFQGSDLDLFVRTGTLGRVRQMLAEANSYSDLNERIDSIKASDRHSDNLVPDRDKAKKLVSTVWARTCGAHKKLLELWGGNAFQLWKKPMMQMIHLLYYGK